MGKKRKSPEADISREFVKQLKQLEALNQTNIITWTHIDNGQVAGKDAKSRAIAGGIAKSMGTRKGWPDYQFIMRDADFHLVVIFIEMKAPKGRLGAEQKEFMDLCGENDVPYYVCRSAREALYVLERHGAIK